MNAEHADSTPDKKPKPSIRQIVFDIIAQREVKRIQKGFEAIENRPKSSGETDRLYIGPLP